MPPKTKKSKQQLKAEKKLAVQRQTELLNGRKRILDAAHNFPDHLEHFAPFRKFQRNELDLGISFVPIQQMAADDLTTCFDLLKQNMYQHYIDSNWGWNDKQKLHELKHDDSRFLLARDAKTNEIVGFCHVRFDWEDEMMILYVYEIQLKPEVRRKSLGKFLMQLCELIARKAQMEGIFLTVLGTDTDSRLFYDALGFEEDYTTNEEVKYEGAEEGKQYSILCKIYKARDQKTDNTNEK